MQLRPWQERDRYHGKENADPDWVTNGCEDEGVVQRLLESVRQL